MDLLVLEKIESSILNDLEYIGRLEKKNGNNKKNLKCYNCKTLNLDRKRDACGFCISKTN